MNLIFAARQRPLALQPLLAKALTRAHGRVSGTLRLNEWAEPEDRLVQRADLEACTRDHTDPLAYRSDDKPYMITVDLGLKHDSTVVVVLWVPVIVSWLVMRRFGTR